MIDCDIHNEVPSLEILYPYLPAYWVAYGQESAFAGPDAADYPPLAPTSVAPQASNSTSDLAQVQRELLDPWGTEIAILNCAYRVQSVRAEDLAADLATAVNRWQVERWLTPEPRLRASIVVPSQNPQMAAEEIARWGEHPAFVQVILPVRSETPYGNRRYDPLFAAAVQHDLVVGIHFGGAPGNPPTPAGWPSTYLEEYAGMAQVFQSQVMNMVYEGLFDRFPQLRVVLIEGGFTWLPSLMWRMDKEWKGLRHNVPWVKRPPSAYIREHFRFTLQPMDQAPTSEQMAQILEQMESEDLLLFSTDYPHWHFDSPDQALPSGLNEGQRQKILNENARTFYRL